MHFLENRKHGRNGMGFIKSQRSHWHHKHRVCQLNPPNPVPMLDAALEMPLPYIRYECLAVSKLHPLLGKFSEKKQQLSSAFGNYFISFENLHGGLHRGWSTAWSEIIQNTHRASSIHPFIHSFIVSAALWPALNNPTCFLPSLYSVHQPDYISPTRNAIHHPIPHQKNTSKIKLHKPRNPAIYNPPPHPAYPILIPSLPPHTAVPSGGSRLCGGSVARWCSICRLGGSFGSRWLAGGR